MFQYRGDQLYCEGVPLAAIATKSGTPVYIYSQEILENRAQAYRAAAGDDLVCFAVKANGNVHLLRILAGVGLGADVTSGGELFLARQAGIAPDKIIFSGVGKRADEIKMAMEVGIKALHVESAAELALIQDLASSMKMRAAVSIRVNPDIRADTHPYDSTGELGHKFGVPREIAKALYHQVQEDENLEAAGLAAHIGSQITSLQPYQELAAYLTAFARELQDEGIHLRYIDMGGGLGVDYRAETVPSIGGWVTAVAEPARAAGFAVVVEPGRSIGAPAGVLMCQVTATKKQGGKSFVIVDAGMNDLIRPAMYGAYHPCLPVRADEAAGETVDIVGPICETGDFLALDRRLPAMQAGDWLAFIQAGAYGFAMSSNYNGRLRAAEVLVSGEQWRIIRRRQVYDDLLQGMDAGRPLIGS